MATWNSLEDDDEFFGAADEHDEIREVDPKSDSEPKIVLLDEGLAKADSRAVTERHRILGYHENYETAKEESLQQGFEAGYREHFTPSKKIGELLGRFSARALLEKDDESAEARKTVSTQALRLVKDHLISGLSDHDKDVSQQDGSTTNSAKIDWSYLQDTLEGMSVSEIDF